MASPPADHPVDRPLDRLDVRPIRADDDERLVRMFARLSRDTLYRRFLTPVTEPKEWAVHHLTDVDHDDRDALVALDGDEVVAVARYDRSPGDPSEAEAAVTVEDGWQRHGVGTMLAGRLERLALERGIRTFTATMLGDNVPALELVQKTAPGASVRSSGHEDTLVIPLGERR